MYFLHNYNENKPERHVICGLFFFYCGFILLQKAKALLQSFAIVKFYRSQRELYYLLQVIKVQFIFTSTYSFIFLAISPSELKICICYNKYAVLYNNTCSKQNI